MIEPKQSLKATQTYGKKLDQLRTRLVKLNQAIYDLGSNVEGSLPETQQGGLIYQKIMELDAAADALSERMNNIVVHVNDLDIDDCDPIRVPELRDE